MKRLVAARGELAQLRAQAQKDGMRPLRLAGAQKVAAGVTTLQEVLKVAPLYSDA